jgi:hypothetical protein
MQQTKTRCLRVVTYNAGSYNRFLNNDPAPIDSYTAPSYMEPTSSHDMQTFSSFDAAHGMTPNGPFSGAEFSQPDGGHRHSRDRVRRLPQGSVETVELDRGQRQLHECFCVPMHQCPTGSAEGDLLIGHGFIGGSSGQFNDGQFNDGQYSNGHFKNGQFNEGLLNNQHNGQFNNGQFNNGQFSNGHLNNGQFDSGQFNNGQFDIPVQSSPIGAFKDYSRLIDPRTLQKNILASQNLDTLDLTDQPGVKNNRAR